MSRILVVTWDGAGNLVPTLGLARQLAERGHDVRLLGHRSIAARCGSHGWDFRPYSHTPDCDSAVPGRPDDPAALARDVWFSGAVARDVQDELSREGADALIVDCMLFGGLSAGEASGLPTIALFHGAFALFREGALAGRLNASMPALNIARRELRLDPVDDIASIHDPCARCLVAVPREFEPAVPLPANVRFVGPILDGPALVRGTAAAANQHPGVHAAGRRVVVSFSTSDQGQLPLLRKIAQALKSVAVDAVITTGPAVDPAMLPSGPRTTVLRFAPHSELVPSASLVVTHAGLGTVMTALAHGVPVLCIPLGRDQFFNAARVQALSAGATLSAAASADEIAAATRSLLVDDHARAGARTMALAIANHSNGRSAAAEIEQVIDASTSAVPAA